MTIRAALTRPSVKRLIALTAVYVLALQTLFGAGAQLRVLLAETPGLCTILGFQEPGQPKHAMDACTIHCAGHASQDSAAVAAAIAALLTGIAGWTLTQRQTRQCHLRPAFAFRGRAPPR
jgi:hypothetical protein